MSMGKAILDSIRNHLNLTDYRKVHWEGSFDEYLDIVAQWLSHFKIAGASSDAVRQAALQWALQRGSRSGRVAWQFARDWAGRSRIARGK